MPLASDIQEMARLARALSVATTQEGADRLLARINKLAEPRQFVISYSLGQIIVVCKSPKRVPAGVSYMASVILRERDDGHTEVLKDRQGEYKKPLKKPKPRKTRWDRISEKDWI